MEPVLNDLVYDWNVTSDGFDWSKATVDIQDETLRDGAQSASVVDPPVAAKVAFLHLAAALAIPSVDLGFPAAGPTAAADVRALAREIATQRLPMAATCAARTVAADVDPVTAASQAAGLPIEVATFVGASAIRRHVEGWTLDAMLRRVDAVVTYAVRAGHEVMFVTEDTTRTEPETLRALYGAAIRAGARRVCLADTVGHATPDGVRRLVRFVRDAVVTPGGEAVAIDWHGHRDRGLGLANCLAAIEAGANRVHATALGLGERVGNVEMEPLLLNLRLLGASSAPLTALPEYSRHAAAAFGVDIPASYPVVGADAFATGTGIHAAAILKAKDPRVAELVYACVPARELGQTQTVRVGPYSGAANVRWWLAEHGYDTDDTRMIAAVLLQAKTSRRVLTDHEIAAVLSNNARRASSSAPATAPA